MKSSGGTAVELVGHLVEIHAATLPRPAVQKWPFLRAMTSGSATAGAVPGHVGQVEAVLPSRSGRASPVTV